MPPMKRGILPAGAGPIAERDLADHRYALTALGYAVVPNALPHAYCTKLGRLLQQVLDSHVPAGSARSVLDRYLMHDLLCRDVAFARLIEDPRLQQLLAPFLGEHWILYAFTSSSLPPGKTNYGRRLHVDSPRHVPGYATNMGVIWALDDFTALNGATEVLPGSHHASVEPGEQVFERHKVVVECPKGSMVIFNARLFHRSGINRSGQWRHAVTMNACRAYMKQRMDWVRFVPREIADALNPQGRRLLGYDTRLPASLEELFLPEEQRLYKPGQG